METYFSNDLILVIGHKEYVERVEKSNFYKDFFVLSFIPRHSTFLIDFSRKKSHNPHRLFLCHVISNYVIYNISRVKRNVIRYILLHLNCSLESFVCILYRSELVGQVKISNYIQT